MGIHKHDSCYSMVICIFLEAMEMARKLEIIWDWRTSEQKRKVLKPTERKVVAFGLGKGEIYSYSFNRNIKKMCRLSLSACVISGGVSSWCDVLL